MLAQEYHAHVSLLQARLDRQEDQLAELAEANRQAVQALVQCRSSADTIEQLNSKVRSDNHNGKN